VNNENLLAPFFNTTKQRCCQVIKWKRLFDSIRAYKSKCSENY